MKKILFIAVFCTSHAWSTRLVLEEFDQLKLASLLEDLPAEFRDKIYEPRVIKTIFPKNGADSAFLITCKSKYYNESEYPSASGCEVKIDLNHADIENGYDELRSTFKDRDWIEPLYRVIPYGKPRKEIYSFGRDNGIKFDGKKGRVFHYHISCSTRDCIFNFSEKKIKN